MFPNSALVLNFLWALHHWNLCQTVFYFQSVCLNTSGVADVGCIFGEVYCLKNSLPFWNYQNFLAKQTTSKLKRICKAKEALKKPWMPAEVSHGRHLIVHSPIFTAPPCRRHGHTFLKWKNEPCGRAPKNIWVSPFESVRWYKSRRGNFCTLVISSTFWRGKCRENHNLPSH